MKKPIKILVFIAFAALFLIPVANDGSMTTNSQLGIQDGGLVSGDQDEASWWNSTFLYRRYFNITEPDVSDRLDTPVHLYLTFENLHCYMDSIRVMYYNSTGGDHWDSVPFQIWNTSFYPGSEFIQSTRVSFTVDLAKGVTEGDYYVYYAQENVGSVSYPDYYPFIYRSYTFSLVNLVSYYDNNQYLVEMWDGSSWDDPRNVDVRWSAGTLSSTNEPNGTLSKYGNVRYEPSSSDYTNFWGYYSVYSNYPLAVSMGQGDKGSNAGINDWFPGVNEIGHGVGTKFVLGGVEGFESRNEGKYWIQAQEDNTDIYVWTTSEILDTGWSFYNGTTVTVWPAVLQAGEYIAKRDVLYTTYMMANSTKPVTVRAGDSDSTYARDIGGYFSSINGDLVGEEFYTIDMGSSSDKTRVTNIGDTPVTVEWWRNTGSGWVKGADLVDIPANGSANIPAGTASSTNPEDCLRILGPVGSKLFVEGIYSPPTVVDQGDWAPTMTGDRFGLDYRIWAGRSQKIMIMAWADVSIDISSYSGSSTIDIAAGEIGFFMPSSSSQSLHDLHANGTISIVVAGKFNTASPYAPSGDQGYGWMVPSYYGDGDQAGFIIESSGEIKLFEFDITVRDLDGDPITDAYVELLNTDNSPWLDDNGFGRSGTTDANGLIVFEGLHNQTFRISTEIDAANWLSTDIANIWVTDSTDRTIDGSVTYVTIILNLASIDIYFEDLMGNAMVDNDNEDTNIRLDTDTSPDSTYVAQAQTDATGTAHFYRVPQDDYNVFARYAGSLGWSYGYTDIQNYASWSIASSEFTGGSFSHDWDLPLITLDIHAESWDALDVEGATINIENTGTYSHTKFSDVNGDYSFYRILNGTWDIDVFKADDYSNTPLARNNTVTLTDLQDYKSQVIQLPLSRLVIRVQTGPTTYVEGAQVNVTMRGDGLVAQGTTNSTGHVTFYNIHANMSTPYSVSYNLTVVSGLQSNGTINELLAKCDYDYWYINKILIGVPDYSSAYTEMNSTAYFVNQRWGRNATFTVGWFDRTGSAGSYITSLISLDGTSWLKFTIYDDTTIVGSDTWTLASSTWISHTGGTINFPVIIDIDFWKLNVSSTAYKIVIEADTNLKDAPAPISIYLTVLAAQTSEGVGTSDIVESFGTHYQHLYWMNDLTNGGYANNLDVYTFAVKFGTLVKSSGSLIDNANGTYSLPETALIGINVGTYVITITLQKANYINQTILVGATINELPMIVEFTSVSNYTWSTGTESIEFEYQIAWNTTATDLTGVSVHIEWVNLDSGLSFLNTSKVLTASSGTLTYSFNGNLLPVGNWIIQITCSYANYEDGFISYNTITVSEAMTTLTLIGSDSQIVDWTEPSTFLFDYKRGPTGLEGATIVTDWIGTVTIEYLGNGRYAVTFDTTVPAAASFININFTLANHEGRSEGVNLQILVPILIQTDYGSEETPLVAYWTRDFNVTIELFDISRVDTAIVGATVEYWDYPNFLDFGSLTEISPGVYQVTLNGDDADPLTNEYQIRIIADDGSSVVETTIFLLLQDVPNEILIENGGYVPYYGDVVTITFYWNNTLDNVAITLPSSASFVVEPLDVGVGGLTNYGNGTYSFDVDTKSLEMFVDPYNGFYRIRISMQADGFEPVEDVFVFFLMRESPTSMVSTGDTEVTWSEDATITVDLIDSRHSVYIWTDVVVELVYNGEVIEILNPLGGGNGTFQIVFDSSLYFASQETTDSPYELYVRYRLPNYVDGQIEIALRVNAIAGEIAMITAHLQDANWQGTWTDIVEMQVWAFYEGVTTHLPQGVATYFWPSYPGAAGGTFSYASLIYTMQVDTSQVPAGTTTLCIIVTLQNHTVAPLNIVMEINPLEADFETTTTGLEAIHGSTETSRVAFTLTYNGTTLLGAEVAVVWNSVEFGHTLIGNEYVVFIRPSEVSGLSAPETYTLTFTMTRENYTADPILLDMVLLAPSSITVEDTLDAEYGETITVIYQYINDLTGSPISNPTLSAYILTDSGTIPLTVVQYNATHYSVDITAADVGEISGEPYTIVFEAEAYGYQAYTGAETGLAVDFYVREPTYNIPLLGRFPQSDVNQTLLLIALFGIIAGSVILGRRMRIPYQIKQIDRALKQIEKGKTGKVEKIKTIGMVISELLAPGLAELDIEAPIIESGPEESYEQILDDDTEDLLGELDALDDVGLDTEESDFEAELDAELDAISEEEPILKQAKPEVEPAPEAEVEEVIEPEPEEAEAELEFEEPEAAEGEAEVEEVVEPEPEEIEAELEFEEPDAETVEDEIELEPEVEEAESESEIIEIEEEAEEIIEPEPEVESESADEVGSEEPTKRLSKKEMIDLLPPEIRAKYPDEDLRKLSKSELQELLDYMEE
ncbi:carboxypeptidase regulatory-like domain-containing protein [Candidatus Thorarchaeota archaeon]|nr:MAG: carboxypeptidase regulatory-like domain-containing protein [Candidatus Thorarchaeota archaeon]